MNIPKYLSVDLVLSLTLELPSLSISATENSSLDEYAHWIPEGLEIPNWRFLGCSEFIDVKAGLLKPLADINQPEVNSDPIGSSKKS